MNNGAVKVHHVFNQTLSKGQMAESYTIFVLESIFLQFFKSYFQDSGVVKSYSFSSKQTMFVKCLMEKKEVFERK